MLKALLQTLFKLSGSQSFPSDTAVEVVVPVETQFKYTAPSDGYLCFHGDSAVAHLNINTSNYQRSLQISDRSGGWAAGFMPLKKGESVVAYILPFGETTSAKAHFVSSVGAE